MSARNTCAIAEGERWEPVYTHVSFLPYSCEAVCTTTDKRLVPHNHR